MPYDDSTEADHMEDAILADEAIRGLRRDIRELNLIRRQKELDKEKVDAEKLYKEACLARVGQTITCPGCGESVIKNTYHKKFCGKRCKDHYWNGRPHRIERTKRFMDKESS